MSIIFKLIPFNRICSSKISLVVPAISVTIAFSSPINKFRKEDFPALGFPTITVLIPSFKILPLSAEESNLFTSKSNSSTIAVSLSGYSSNVICSGSSKADSIKAISYIIFARNSLIFSETAPFNWLTEDFNASSFFA